MPFPKDAKIFDLTIADIRRQGTLDTIVLDDFDRLNILSPEGKFLWKSQERYGGTTIYYETLKKKPDAFRPQEAPPWRVYIPARILIRDLDGDGIPEVIINKNESSTGTLFKGFRIYEKGEIYNLVWDENSLTTNWKTREIKGYIADYQVKDVDNDGEEELVVAVVNPGTMTERKGTSNILFFKLF